VLITAQKKDLMSLAQNQAFRLYCLLLLSFGSIVTAAQSGTIAGTIIDEETGETLIGAAVFLESDNSIGSATDLDGQYRVTNVPVGIHNVVIRSVGYSPKTITGVEVKEGELTTVNSTLGSAATELEAVMVTAEFDVESVAAVYTMQKKAISVQDGISRDIIARSPDGNSGEVLKRLPGTTIEKGRFAIVRGLADRYNIAVMNDLILPSTEPDRKTFSFDLYPSGLLDYMIITKTAQPDLPGEFAGGIIQLATRDIPDENFLDISIGTSFETKTTFNDFETYQGASTDWLGMDNGLRDLPDNFPTVDTFRGFPNNGPERAFWTNEFHQSADYPNRAASEIVTAQPNRSMQLAGGFSKGETNRFGAVFGLTYSGSQSVSDARSELRDQEDFQLFEFSDVSYANNVLWGGLVNLAYKLGDKNKFYFRNDFSVNSSDESVVRVGAVRDNLEGAVRSRYYEFITAQLFNTSLSGEHSISEAGMKLDWTLGYNTVNRDQPDSHTNYYLDGDTLDGVDDFTARIPTTLSYPLWGHYFGYLTESTYSGTASLTVPFNIGERKQSFKFGGYVQTKDREFSARIFGYEAKGSFLAGQTWNVDGDNGSPLNLSTPEVILSNIGEDEIYLDEGTQNRDRYFGDMQLYAGYGMFDNRFGEKFRLVWGVRVERWEQSILTFANSNSGDSIQVDGTETSILPSLNLTYSLNDKTNLRFSAYQTVARPEFREKSNFTYYNFETFQDVGGNVDLLPTDIYNADIRYEYFPGNGQILSASVFFKYFENPISYFKAIQSGSGVGSRTDPINEKSAVNVGTEVELRKHLGFLGAEDLEFSTNLAYIYSRAEVNEADTTLVAQIGDTERGLIYQSPWIVNLGLSYQHPERKYSASVLYNVSGTRRVALGNVLFPDVWEEPIPQLDAQVTFRIFEGAKIKIAAEDILASETTWFQDLGSGNFADPDENGKYDPETDILIFSQTPRTRISVGFSWSIK
jgi:hypothetical protein